MYHDIDIDDQRHINKELDIYIYLGEMYFCKRRNRVFS